MSTKVVDFYCDSSSHRGHRYLVAGGIISRTEVIERIDAKIQKIKTDIDMKSEFKWSGFRGGRKTKAYFELIDFFYFLIANNHIHFHAIVANFDSFDHHRKGRGSPEKSVNKLYYQLFLHRLCREYGTKNRIRIFPDHGADSAEIIEFRKVLCRESANRYNTDPNCLKAIQPQPSARHNILQMVDVIIGALAAEFEARDLNAHKSELRRHVIKQSPTKNLFSNTPRGATKFTIWHFGK